MNLFEELWWWMYFKILIRSYDMCIPIEPGLPLPMPTEKVEHVKYIGFDLAEPGSDRTVKTIMIDGEMVEVK